MHVDETAFRRSLRASRARRDAAARQARRRRGGRRGAALALAGLAFASTGAMAAETGGAVKQGTAYASATTVAALQKALGVDADGVVGPQTRAAIKRFQRSKGLTADGVAGAETLSALGLSAKQDAPDAGAPAEAATTAAAAPSGRLAAIAQCESGGDPTAISAGGRYRGKYQFTRSTWRSLGGTGDPAKADEATQDRIALALYRQSGTSPWPVCGRR